MNRYDDRPPRHRAEGWTPETSLPVVIQTSDPDLRVIRGPVDGSGVLTIPPDVHFTTLPFAASATEEVVDPPQDWTGDYPPHCGRTYPHARHDTTAGECPGLDPEQVQRALDLYREHTLVPDVPVRTGPNREYQAAREALRPGSGAALGAALAAYGSRGTRDDDTVNVKAETLRAWADLVAGVLIRRDRSAEERRDLAALQAWLREEATR